MEEELKIYPNPKWADDFKNRIKDEFNLSILDASCITGLVIKLVREREKKAENWINDNMLNYCYDEIGSDPDGMARDFRNVMLED